jgi:tetraacyldisaccharide 4'-kinase
VKRVLFVSNGHGEIAIASRIALELQSGSPVPCDHLALVGDFKHPSTMRDVGPRRAMPSGGVIAMLNVRNIGSDLRAGLLGHTLAQLRFLRGVRGTYSVVIAVGDVFSLIMALQAGATSTVFVGTAKSVYVAPYGPFEERIIRNAGAVFVRDLPTAQRLQSHGIAAQAANAIVDLYALDRGEIDVPFDPLVAIFPGSREPAYDDAVRLARIVRTIAAADPRAGAILSIAPGIDANRMSTAFEGDGWRVDRSDRELEPFSLLMNDREIVRAWQGPLGAMLRRADVVLGQAGTANEAAAALGIPVIAFARGGESRAPWYRMRQIALLGDAIMVASADENEAAHEVIALLHDLARRERMGRIGRERMGEPGAAAAIAAQIASLVRQ